MAGLGGLKRSLRRLGVAKLADQDHVGVLAERAAECLAERLGVETHFALVDDALIVRVKDLDRVLDRDDVLRTSSVDLADHRRERRRLARTGGSGDEDQAAVLVRQPRNA